MKTTNKKRVAARSRADTITTAETVLSLSVIAKPYHLEEWLGSAMPQGAARTMSRLEDAITGLGGIIDILDTNRVYGEQARIAAGISYTPINGRTAYELAAAQRVLIGEAHASIEHIKAVFVTMTGTHHAGESA